MKFMTKWLVLTLINAYSLSAQVSGLTGWSIFLDPGHSRTENMGIYGYSEAEKNLRVGLRLREMLLKTTDIDTVYISRTNDRQQVSLSQRTDYANSVAAAWFHSIHSDAGPPQYNSTLLLWGQLYDGTPDPPVGGEQMSDIMVGILTRGLRTNSRGSIGDCSFYSYTGACSPSWPGPYLHVNRESNMPSELSEAGFHTNPKQNQLNMNAEWKKLEAKTFYWSILKYFGIERPFVGTCVGIVSDKESGVPINGALITLNGQSDTTDTFESLFHNYTGNPDLLHNGFYYFENLPDDTLQMIVQAEGYYSDTSPVAIVDTFFTFKDVRLINAVPPYIVSTTPAQGDTNFPAWDNIRMNFSRKMNRASVETTLVIIPETDITIIWSNNDTRMTIRTDTLKYETDYTIIISGNATDGVGHLFDGNIDGIGGDDFILNFKTGPPDMTPPNLVSIYPPANANNIELLPIINVTYDEQLNSSSITENIFKLERRSDYATVSGVLEHYVVNTKSTLCFFPDNQLMPDETYRIKIFPGLEDMFGNTVTATMFFLFNTADYDFKITTIDNFESDVTNNWWAPQQSGSTTGILTENTGRNASQNIINFLTGSTTSLQIDYGWDLNASAWLIRVYLGGGAPKNVHFNSSYIMQAYVFGDGSSNQFRFCVDDNVPHYIAANHEVSPWFTIDWIGWKLITWDMANDGTGTWIGDGNLDGTLRFDSIQLTYNPGNPITGTVYFDDLRLVTKEYIGIDEPFTSLPDEFILHQNYPNPFNPETAIRYQVPEGRHHVRLVIYDVLGKRVRTLVDEQQTSNQYLVKWDGKDEQGNAVASGVYMYKLTVRNFTQSRRMVLVR